MIGGFGLKLVQQKGGFFDRLKVISAMSDASRRALNQCGALVRKTAQFSMRYAPSGASAKTAAKTPYSTPGNPPFAHQRKKSTIINPDGSKVVTEKGFGPLLRKLLFYSYDASRKSVVVGPSNLGTGVPKLHEFGGTKQASRFKMVAGNLVRTPYQAKYPPRPYMRPALEKCRNQFAKFWKNSIRRRSA